MGVKTQFNIEVESLSTGVFIYVNDKVFGSIKYDTDRQMAADAHDFLMEIDDMRTYGPVTGQGVEVLEGMAKLHTIH